MEHEKSNGTIRERLGAIVESRSAELFILTLVIVNAVILGLETSPAVMARAGHALVTLDHFLLAIFVIELCLKMVVHGARFFHDPWRVFDTLVVGVALAPSAGPLAVLRAFRVLRVLRLVTMVPTLRKVVAGLLDAIPGLGSVAGLMAILYYVASVIATKLFGADFPEWFGSLPASAYTLFQVMTLESWSMGIVRPVMEKHPDAWAFFVPYILVATFTLLNLFIAVIVNAVSAAAAAHDVVIESKEDQILAELRALREEVQRLREPRGD